MTDQREGAFDIALEAFLMTEGSALTAAAPHLGGTSTGPWRR
jgi:hypothetical protein